MRTARLAALALLLALTGSLGCFSFTVGDPPDPLCYRAETEEESERWSPEERRRRQVDRAQRGCGKDSLTIGFFPTVGEAHQNKRATNGRSLTWRLRLADYTLRPFAIAAINLLSLGIPTATATALEVYEDYSPRPGQCARALLGYCKGRKLIPRPELPPPPENDPLAHEGPGP